MAPRWRRRRRQTEAAGHPYVNLRRRPTEPWNCSDLRAYQRKSTRAFRCVCVSLRSVSVCALLTAWTEAQPQTGTDPLELSAPTSVYFSWLRVRQSMSPHRCRPNPVSAVFCSFCTQQNHNMCKYHVASIVVFDLLAPVSATLSKFSVRMNKPALLLS